jgi:Nucleoside-diphosphate-sugar epimerases
MYGEHMVGTRYGQVIPEFIKRMLFEDQFTILGDGSHTRSFCYIRDGVKLIRKLLVNKNTGIINLGNDHETNILDLAKKIHALDNRTFNPIFLADRPNDHVRRKPDLTYLKSLVPDLKFTNIDVGLKKTINFYKNHKE